MNSPRVAVISTIAAATLKPRNSRPRKRPPGWEHNLRSADGLLNLRYHRYQMCPAIFLFPRKRLSKIRQFWIWLIHLLSPPLPRVKQYWGIWHIIFVRYIWQNKEVRSARRDILETLVGPHTYILILLISGQRSKRATAIPFLSLSNQDQCWSQLTNFTLKAGATRQ